MTPQRIVDRVIDLYNEKGHRSYGEDVTELEHALQAATFARQFGEPAPIVAACLLHDYGHLLHDMGEDIADQGVDAHHEDLGAKALARWFVPEVVEPGRLHVAAKRFLCARDRQYFEGLSPASRQSLVLQGGPMSDEEARQFEADPHYRAAVQVRRYDDMGKVPGMKTPPLEEFRPLLEAFVLPAGAESK
jgi:phosphonate degradation associated HDIG domain protein